jgi:hypothetical protein
MSRDKKRFATKHKCRKKHAEFGLICVFQAAHFGVITPWQRHHSWATWPTVFCPETSIMSYQPVPHNILEKPRSQLYCGGKPTCSITQLCQHVNNLLQHKMDDQGFGSRYGQRLSLILYTDWLWGPNALLGVLTPTVKQSERYADPLTIQ